MKRLTGILKIKNKNMPFKSKGNKMFFSFFFHVQSRTSGYNDFRVVIRQTVLRIYTKSMPNNPCYFFYFISPDDYPLFMANR